MEFGFIETRISLNAVYNGTPFLINVHMSGVEGREKTDTNFSRVSIFFQGSASTISNMVSVSSPLTVQFP